MFDFYLPHRKQFIQILSNNEIKQWEAKVFWSYFTIKKGFPTQYLRQKMYSGLKILHRHGYLEVKISPLNPRLFLYSETPKLKSLKDKTLINDYENIFKKEIQTINFSLEKINNLEALIDELSITYPELKNKLVHARNEITLNKICQKKKLETFNELLQIVF